MSTNHDYTSVKRQKRYRERKKRMATQAKRSLIKIDLACDRISAGNDSAKAVKWVKAWVRFAKTKI